MALDPGTSLGPYTLADKIGAGGMGEVYRATDTKLGREVAIKTLPAALADDQDRLARFEREAKMLAALNHPHIASVYSLDKHDGTVFIAMELVEGETLEARLKRGPLPLDDALRTGMQIAEALEAAHEKGVVHRDLKPANVMVNRNGQVKVLDFGLAKAFAGNPLEASPAHSPALSVAMTQQGLVLGTAGYMSPEQASGQANDQRADVWAFGVVLFEMITGQPVFSGETVPHILAAVLQNEPDWSQLPKALHPQLKRVLQRCLTKRPRSRYHSIADVRIELEGVLADPTGASLPAAGPAAAARSSWLRVAGVAVAAAIVAAAAGWLLRPVPEPEPGPVVRFSMPLPVGQQLSVPPVNMIAVSPDGTRIVYVADNQLFIREMGEPDMRPVQGTQSTGNRIGAATPVFSPDGQWVAYVDVAAPNGPYQIKRVPVSGGAPVLLNEGPTGLDFQQGLSWPRADTMLFSNASGIVRMPANGGAVEVLVPRADDERVLSPQLLPDGETVLYTRVPGPPGSNTGYDRAQVMVLSIGGGEPEVVWEGGSAARYVPSGHLVYAQETALFAIAFDAATRTISGGPVPLLNNLRRSTNGVTDAANFDVSATGTLVMLPGQPGSGNTAESIETTVYWVGADGREEPLPIRPDDYTMARVSPDGTKIALVVGNALGRAQAPAIWIYDIETRNLSLLTTEMESVDGPVWTADSSALYARSLVGTEPAVYRFDLDSREATLIAESNPDGFPFPMPWSLSPDGETLAIINAQTQTDVDVATVSIADGQLTRLLFGEGNQSEPAIAPNGQWMAYSDGSPTAGLEINLRPWPAIYRTRIPVAPGISPVFSNDGSKLYFFDLTEGIRAVDVSYEPSISVGTPRQVIGGDRWLYTLFGRAWDVAPEGERFIMIRNPATPASELVDDAERLRIDVVLNWVEELKVRVPTQ